MAKHGSPHKVRMFEESEDFLDEWFKPSKRSSAERKIYGPSLVNEKIALLKEFHKKVHKNPVLLEDIRADLAEREAAHPAKSRYRLRMHVIHDHMKSNKKLGMKTKYYKGPGIGLYELFKGRKIVDDIFGDDLITSKIFKYNEGNGLVDIPASLGIVASKKPSSAKTKKSSPKGAKKASSAKTAKRKRCPNGTRFNKKTKICEPKKN